ncbi:hypothetical protein [Gallibacterium anatis]|uniref:hypothetical protein n=1 Tax=Gallibacterium anatis TaxID=750 RepID=UPI000B9FF5D4|nr:hypothetical protein [Gallibacterium anatis]WAX71292.1 hypothetical protein CF557_11035 [Gallibacterium anatis]
MNRRNILCVTEGAKTEIQILEQLNQVFIRRDITFIPFSTNIYVVYNDYLKLKGDHNDDDFDMFVFLKNYDKKNILGNKKRNDFTDILLFMDLDRHHLNKIKNPLEYNKLVNCLPEMLNLFNDSIENGKLFISYPMVEAFKHPIKNNELWNILLGKQYKSHVQGICDKKLENFNNHSLNKEQWSKFLLPHVFIINFLINQQFSYPVNYQEINKFDQSTIYQKQCQDYIMPSNECLVLSPFALFLLEFLGENLFNEWQNIDNDVSQ